MLQNLYWQPIKYKLPPVQVQGFKKGIKMRINNFSPYKAKNQPNFGMRLEAAPDLFEKIEQLPRPVKTSLLEYLKSMAIIFRMYEPTTSTIKVSLVDNCLHFHDPETGISDKLESVGKRMATDKNLLIGAHFARNMENLINEKTPVHRQIWRSKIACFIKKWEDSILVKLVQTRNTLKSLEIMGFFPEKSIH